MKNDSSTNQTTFYAFRLRHKTVYSIYFWLDFSVHLHDIHNFADLSGSTNPTLQYRKEESGTSTDTYKSF